ncbi:MAG: hypothetical protein ABIA21_04190 [Candidatus Aenigmatarchaeota archaeon]
MNNTTNGSDYLFVNVNKIGADYEVNFSIKTAKPYRISKGNFPTIFSDIISETRLKKMSVNAGVCKNISLDENRAISLYVKLFNDYLELEKRLEKS